MSDLASPGRPSRQSFDIVLMAATFLEEFKGEVARSVDNDFSDNYDALRFGPLPPSPSARGFAVKKWVKQHLSRKGYLRPQETAALIEHSLGFAAPWLARLEKLHSLLADSESKSLLVKLMAFRALGHRKIKLPFNAPALREGIKQMERVTVQADSLPAGFMGWTLNRVDLAGLGLPVSLYTIPADAYIMFVAQQYRCLCEPPLIEAAEGDYVIDGGGCWGDTALYFSHKVGDTGRVWSFEFVPANLEIMRRNLDQNLSLKKRVSIVENALWRKSNESLCYSNNGPGTQVSQENSQHTDQTARTLSIDDLVAENKLPRLDFIKMDIEGSELEALNGAEQTLRQFKPKLAICVYHRLEDFFEIPDYLESLGLNYRFFIRHFSIHSEETVLFARAD